MPGKGGRKPLDLTASAKKKYLKQQRIDRKMKNLTVKEAIFVQFRELRKKQGLKLDTEMLEMLLDR